MGKNCAAVFSQEPVLICEEIKEEEELQKKQKSIQKKMQAELKFKEKKE